MADKINLKDVREALGIVRDGVNCDVEDFDSMDRLFFAHDKLADMAPAMAEALLKAWPMMQQAKIVAAVLQGEMTRSGGAPFTGAWSIPDLNARVTCDEALNRVDDALAAFLECVEGRE